LWSGKSNGFKTTQYLTGEQISRYFYTVGFKIFRVKSGSLIGYNLRSVQSSFSKKIMKIKFIGATEAVTGSKHLLITEGGSQVLLDCGLYQGFGKEKEEWNKKLDVNPSAIEAVILSHAHIDHSGNLPNLVKQGFNGKIYCTQATFDVCKVLLMDSAHIHENDVLYLNRRRERQGLPPVKPLYSVADAEQSLKFFNPVAYRKDCRVNNELSFMFTDTGHIIGSAAVNIICREHDKVTRLTFSGDVGRYKDMLLKAPEVFPQADYIICESTYGDRLHDIDINAESKLLEIVNHTCVEKQGKLIIPAFSLGRTQEIVFALDKMKNQQLLPDVKIYVDSPLSSSATEIMRKHKECLNASIHAYIQKDPDPFGFNSLTYIQSAEESKALNANPEPCIIISASGMADAGRVKHHLRNNLTDQKNTVLITGYCAPGTLGHRLVNGEKSVRIFGEYYTVNADIESILSYSAHADYNELTQFLSCQDKNKVKGIFLVHGENEAKASFMARLLIDGYKKVQIPGKGKIVDLE
jgi:metallo-beta-lactamase family protein